MSFYMLLYVTWPQAMFVIRHIDDGDDDDDAAPAQI